MKRTMIWKDLQRNKAVSLTTLLFIAIASLLLSLLSILSVNLFGSIDHLMQEAKTPHFMQMHSGELDSDKLEKFASQTDCVDAFQILPFLGIDSDQIVVNGQSLTDTTQDNGFCTQSEEFDFLLDLEGNRVSPVKGELYAPVFYSKDGVIKIGDTIVINNVSFTVTGFVRDSQMNAALAYSKRFVVNPADYNKLLHFGAVESLIEFRLDDLEQLSSFEAAYSSANLPASGPTLTWPLFRMLSAMSDGIMIAVILLVSILVILIALFCIRFTLLAKIEEDYREIGTMKAIGMRLCDIRQLYLSTYGALTAGGAVLGFVLSLFVYQPLLQNIQKNFGNSGNDSLAFLFGILAILLLFCFILLYVNMNLRRFKKISAAEAIRFGVSETSGKANVFNLSKNRLFSTNFCLGVSDIFARKRMYVTMLVVVILATFILIVPQNLYHTISSKDFVTYMGVGHCDLRMDIQQSDTLDQKTELAANYVQSDPDVSAYTVLTTKSFGVHLEDGTTANLKVELGDHTAFPIQYVEGSMPVSNEEIALSSLIAEEWNKTIDDQITLLTHEGEKQFTVSGIYSDITNGGKTAKAVFTADDTPTAWSIVCVRFANSAQTVNKLAAYEERFDFAKVSSIDDYVSQTFGQTLRSVRLASFVAAIVAVVVTLLVTLLFLKLLVAKDRYSIAVMKTMGFTNTDLKRQFIWRVISVLTIGIILGTILAGTLGEKIAAMAISSFGAVAFHFIVNVPATFVYSPLILLAATLIAAVIGTAKIGRITISTSMKE